ncbi:MAG: 4-hydroxy-3-methylbut-2-enyl diphosphate reductase, partial [Bacteroidales bacterium]|nr:4-hydroxy-3-methylbut-2-enyl diphosphate reductase [Bacteroidales bacterium]
ILFVSGRESSNGKVLYELCRSVNPRTYRLETADQTDLAWFRDGDKVGICGATSTPQWQLEEIFIYLQAATQND